MTPAERELKALALAAQRHGSPMFRTDVPPERILALLSRIERLEAALREISGNDDPKTWSVIQAALADEPGERAT